MTPFTPLPYQSRVVNFFQDHDRAAGFIPMGGGKTSCTLSALRRKLLTGEVRSALIVAPLRVACLTWPNEIAKWKDFSCFRVKSLRDHKPKDAEIYTINYESLTKLPNLDFCDVVIMDELTKLKSNSSKRRKHLSKLFKHHKRWGLTGTPRSNSLLNLWGQISILDDGQRLGRTYTAFRDRWFTSDYMGFKWTPKPNAEEEIYDRIADLQMTLSPEEVGQPNMVVEDIDIALPDEAKAMYRELERELLLMCEAGDVVALNAAALTNKLLQMAAGMVYAEDRGVVPVHTAKLDALKALLKQLGTERTLIATNYIHEREMVCKAIPGAVNASHFKGDIEDAWNSGKLRHLVADPRSLGHGLNLQEGGSTVIWFSPTWDYELYDQFNRRIARRGQKNQTVIYRLLCSGTVDDVVIETLRERTNKQSAMMTLLANLKRFRA